MRKVIVGIQARMGSKRLPGKSLAMLDSHRPLIEWVIRRVQLADCIEGVVLLTSTETADDSLAEFAERLCPIIRGSLADVRSRYESLFETTNSSDLVRVTGDCPLIDGKLIDRLIRKHLTTVADYSHIRAQAYYRHAYPNGMNAEVFTREAFERMLHLGKDNRHLEHVTSVVDDYPSAFHREMLEPPPELDRPKYKLSIDYPEEITFVREVIEELGYDAINATAAQVVSACDRLQKPEKNR